MYFFHDTQKKKITILVDHPDSGTTRSSELALLYEVAAKQAGHEVRRVHLGDMHFDPILHQGYKVIQELEPDLKKLQDDIRWCDHFVLIYPVWWSSMPALLKGLFDRMWIPGFAFSYYKEGMMGHMHLWKKMLMGKTARVIVLSGSHPLAIYTLFGDYTNEIKRAILGFAGFTVRLTRLGPSEKAPEWKLNEWRRKVSHLGTMGE